MGTLVTLDGATCSGSTCYIGNTCTGTTWKLEPLVTGLVVPLGPLMQGLLETLGLTVAGHLVHGQVKVVPKFLGAVYTASCSPFSVSVADQPIPSVFFGLHC